ncbi:DUF4097 family beta strand repeat-containing protein [Lutispora saccharofermentans]|uniref:DUF4097 domain-containing protein n=1 Tax=Lutispora saccharofermentans TaxID=3024236 RepID=A0ABT1NK72_9FIRM|nr:DUF4097 family beta strand repeat-containing protein [Lutispora saccharofermentans]MCQ1531662.1 DUF4097 domain-containing protein [Lutispora saccharofermentans]
MDEKMMILKMLEEGKITSEEALKLLSSIESNATASEKSSSKEFKTEQTYSNNKFNDTINKFSKKAEELADKFGPDFVSKVENVSTDFAEAAVKFADKMVNYISTGFNNTDMYKTLSKNYSFPIENNDKIRVVLKTQNLSVSAVPADKPEVSVSMKLNLFFEDADIDKYISAKYENGVIFISTDFPAKAWGSLEIKAPQYIDSLEIETSNSKCRIENLKGEILHCNTSNAKIEVLDSSFVKLNAKTNNSKIIVSGSKAAYAAIDTSNSNIELEDSCFDILKSNTSNGSIYLSRFDSINDGEAEYTLQTSNGKIKINLPKNNSSGYKINARTSLGNINIPELGASYMIDRRNGNMKAEASVISSSYEASAQKILIDASTSNSSINIADD